MGWNFDFLIVGAGYAGSVLAERLCSQLGKTCLIVEKRHHIAGNAYDEYDSAGVRLHAYGPHYFRTKSDRILQYFSQFTEWHRVDFKILSWTDGRYWQFPINLNTFEQILGRPSTSEEMEDTLEKWRVPIDNPKNSEEVIISQVGVNFTKCFSKITRANNGEEIQKIWIQVFVEEFRFEQIVMTDTFQKNFKGFLQEGYTKMFERMLNNPKIKILLNTRYQDVVSQVTYKHLIYTGPVDEYFDWKFGPLPYRSLRFDRETIEKEFYQPTVQVNYPNDYDFTRIVEIKHVTGQKLPVTTIVREYPDDFGTRQGPYYPIPAPDAQQLYKKYAELAENEKKVSFVGRLATYRYYNMDQVVGMALTEFERIKTLDIR